MEADAACLEMTGASTGVGYEAGWLLARGRPVMMLYDADQPPPSAVVLAPPSDHAISVPYRDLLEIPQAVRAFLRAVAPHVQLRAEG
jgi:hypothetical protein